MPLGASEYGDTINSIDHRGSADATEKDQEDPPAAAAILFSSLITHENADDIAPESEEGAKAKTNATSNATKASIAAYSVIPWPERRRDIADFLDTALIFFEPD